MAPVTVPALLRKTKKPEITPAGFSIFYNWSFIFLF